MKRFKFLSLIATAILMSQSVFAQVDETFVFTKGDNILNDGSEVTVTEIEEQPFTGTKMMKAGVFIKNTTGNNAYYAVEYKIESLPNGNVQICVPQNCVSKSEIGKFETAAGVLKAGASKDMETEWLPQAEGVCKVTYRIIVYDYLGLDKNMKPMYDFLAYGPTVTVIYNNDPSGIENIDADGIANTVYYDLSGAKANATKQGLYIKKTTDLNGNVSTKKVLVK